MLLFSGIESPLVNCCCYCCSCGLCRWKPPPKPPKLFCRLRFISALFALVSGGGWYGLKFGMAFAFKRKFPRELSLGERYSSMCDWPVFDADSKAGVV